LFPFYLRAHSAGLGENMEPGFVGVIVALPDGGEVPLTIRVDSSMTNAILLEKVFQTYNEKAKKDIGMDAFQHVRLS